MLGRDIIFVSNALANGGAARVLSLLANQYAVDGHKVGVLVFRPYDAEFSLNSQIVKEYGPPGGGHSGKLKRIRWIREVVKRNPSSRIIAFEYFVNMQTLIACIGLRNRVIVSERNDPARVGSGFPTDSARAWLYRAADVLVCQTDEAAAYFPDKINTRVILNPIRPDLPDPIQSARRPVVVTFCRLEKQKNLGMLIRAFAVFHEKYPDYSLEIYGDGNERAALASLVASLALQASVSIFPARGDIHEVVKDCAMFVLPSDYEGLSNSMLEAMALGLPTICTDCPCGGARTVLDDGVNGLLIPTGDENALVQAMQKLASNARLAEDLGEHAAEIRNRLSLDTVAREWMGVIQDN